MFIVVPPKQVITGNIRGLWDPDKSVEVVTAVGVPLEEAFTNIGINAWREVINLEYDYEEDW